MCEPFMQERRRAILLRGLIGEEALAFRLVPAARIERACVRLLLLGDGGLGSVALPFEPFEACLALGDSLLVKLGGEFARGEWGNEV
jgi:hypothetical protein